MTYAQQLTIHRQPEAKQTSIAERSEHRAPSATMSISKLLTYILVGLFEIMVLLGLVQLTLGVGHEGVAGPVPAPTPSRGF